MKQGREKTTAGGGVAIIAARYSGQTLVATSREHVEKGTIARYSGLFPTIAGKCPLQRARYRGQTPVTTSREAIFDRFKFFAIAGKTLAIAGRRKPSPL